MSSLLALVDCNNFYVSCERVFRPDLIGKPVAVLSNNDGCIVARSQEVKDLGIKMGVPLFQVQPLVDQHNIQLFSSNYSLYADMSARVMTILASFSPSMEVYSIDEAFLDLTDVSKDPTGYGETIRASVLRNTGIPVCVGIAATKTLAKLANYAAKKWPKTNGVLDLSNPIRREKLLRLVPVCEVWGIGTRTTLRLNQLGIHSAWDLATQSPQHIQAQFSVSVARTVRELNGIACIDLATTTPDKQQIVCSRSFSQRLTDYPQLAKALSSYCLRAAEKLRQQHSVTGHIGVFIRTSPFNANEPHYQRAAALSLTLPTQDSRIIVKTAKHLLQAIYKPGYAYQKCGVQLGKIQADHLPAQLDLYSTTPANGQRVMATLDAINRRFPKALGLAATGFDTRWQAQANRISQRYTTDWHELVRLKCQ